MRITTTKVVVLLALTGAAAVAGLATRGGPVFDEAISRAFTVVNRAGSTPVFDEAISRSFTVINRAGSTPVFDEAISRAFTVINRAGSTPVFDEAISRAFTVINRAGSTPVFDEAISRPFTACNAAGLGNTDTDLDIDLDDYKVFPDPSCMSGPDSKSINVNCQILDFNCDDDVDLADFAVFQRVFTGSLP